MMQSFLDAAALHGALLVLDSLNPNMHKLLPPCAPSVESEAGEKPFGKVALRERVMHCHWILAISYGISEGSKTEENSFPSHPVRIWSASHMDPITRSEFLLLHLWLGVGMALPRWLSAAYNGSESPRYNITLKIRHCQNQTIGRGSCYLLTKSFSYLV